MSLVSGGMLERMLTLLLPGGKIADSFVGSGR